MFRIGYIILPAVVLLTSWLLRALIAKKSTFDARFGEE